MQLINDFLKIRILMDEFLPFKEQNTIKFIYGIDYYFVP